MKRRIAATPADGVKPAWQLTDTVSSLTLTVADGRVLYHAGMDLICCDARTGKEIWRIGNVTNEVRNKTSYAPTLVVHHGVVMITTGVNKASEGGGVDEMVAASLADGRILWKHEHPSCGYRSPEDLLCIDGTVWFSDTSAGALPWWKRNPSTGEVIGVDVKTGELVKRFLPNRETTWFHHRCHRAKATERFLLMSRTGIEYVNPDDEKWRINHWVRGACLYGIMPANGLTYAPPHACVCFIEAKQAGLNALAPARKTPLLAEPGAREVTKGPAFGCFSSLAPASEPPAWPTYRRDNIRSGAIQEGPSGSLNVAWSRNLGGKLSAVTVALGKFFVAQVDQHTMHALDAETGASVWSHTCGGRVDSPPTIVPATDFGGLCIFGSHDGLVQALRVSDGELVWSLRAAPANVLAGAYGQLESPWPVNGSVLVHGGAVYAVAGRSMFLDSGMRLLRLAALTGRVLGETVLDEKIPGTEETLEDRSYILYLPVALPDILSCDGKHVFMRSQLFDLQGKRTEIPMYDVNKGQTAHFGVGNREKNHLFSPTGFLDDAWLHRSFWIHGSTYGQGAIRWAWTGQYVPGGRIMVLGDEKLYGYARKQDYYRWTTALEYELYAADKYPTPKGVPKAEMTPQSRGFGKIMATIPRDWGVTVPVYVRAMVLAGETLFVAGPRQIVNERKAEVWNKRSDVVPELATQVEHWNGKHGALLCARSVGDGTTRGTDLNLTAPPVWDGMACAYRRLYVAQTDGSVTCIHRK